MSPERTDSDESFERLRPKHAIVLGILACVAGGALYTLAQCMLDLPGLDGLYARLAWWLTPWGAHVSTIEEDLHVRFSIGLDKWPTESLDFAIRAVMAGMFLLAAHSATFAVVALLYAKFGRPPYWPDVGSGSILWSAWGWSAFTACWLLPAAGAIWTVWIKLEELLAWVNYPLINTGQGYLVANFAAVVLGLAFIGGTVLRRHVVAAVTADSLRCQSCGYLLRGLPEPRCPECGRRTTPQARAAFGLLGAPSSRWRAAKWTAQLAIPLALLSAPLAVPTVLLQLPTFLQERLPTATQATLKRLSKDPDLIPVRGNTLCLVRRDGALGVVRLRFQPRWWYDVAYWASEAACNHAPPQIAESGPLVLGPGLTAELKVGPWPLTYIYGSQFRWALRRPDSSFDVQVVPPDEFAGKLPWLERHLQDERAP
jgi:hypothetical protein